MDDEKLVTEAPHWGVILAKRDSFGNASSRSYYGGVGSEQRVFAREGEALSQVASCFANGLRMRRISGFNCKRVGSMGGQFLAKPVFKAVCA